MLMIVVLIFVACLLPVVVFAISRRRSASRLSPAELTSQLQPVDIEAFRNLIDPDEESFLQTNLPPALFRSVQRERLRAAIEYVAAVSRNAAILTRVGEAVRDYSDAGVAEAAQELANNAVRLRLHCFLVTANLWTAIALPAASLSSGSVVERYQQINGLTRKLLRMRAPANGSHASVSAG